MTSSIILHPHEIRRALSAGEVLVMRPVKPQPELIAGRTWVWPEDGRGCKWPWGAGVDPNTEDAASRWCPWQPGALLRVRVSMEQEP